MLDGEVDDEELSKDAFVVFWNYFSATYLGHLQQQYPRSRLFLFSHLLPVLALATNALERFYLTVHDIDIPGQSLGTRDHH